MTGSSTRNSRSLRFSKSACSDNQVSEVQSALQDKEKKESFDHDSDKSDATYTKSETKFPLTKLTSNFHEDFSRGKSNSATRAKMRPSNLHTLRMHSSCGILEPTTDASKRAQWLNWNDPTFIRRRSFDEPKLCRRIRSDTTHDHKSRVAAFKRSLQLLGLKYSDLGLEDDIQKERNNDIRIPRGRATPTFSTRLTQRSVSLTNLRNAVQESGLPAFEAVEKLHRDILSRAVYEEWYFRKQTENKIKKELEEEIIKQRDEQLQWIKAERKRMAEENFEKWKKSKDQLRKEQVKCEKIMANKPSSSYARNKPNSEGAFEAWKSRKDEERKTKSNVQKQQEEQEKIIKEKEKKVEAEAAFRAWKQQADEELKNKFKEREREKGLLKEKETELKKKQEDALKSYRDWKIKKDNEMKQKLKIRKVQAKKLAEEKGMKRAERVYDAAQAFELWLDRVDERMEKQKLKKQARNQLPPWYPGI